MTTYVKIYTIKKDNIEYNAEVTYTPDTEVSQVKVNKNEGVSNILCVRFL
jgi:hypothetical protein